MAPCLFHYGFEDQGEVRVEIVHHVDGTIAARANAFVYADRGAASVVWANQNGCQDVSGHDYAPFAIYPSATYHDPGDVLISGGPQPLQLARQASAAPTRSAARTRRTRGSCTTPARRPTTARST